MVFGRIAETQLRRLSEMRDDPSLQIVAALLRTFQAGIIHLAELRSQPGLRLRPGDPDDIAQDVAEAHTPQPQERPMTRKESYDEWHKRSTALIEENRENHQ